MKISSEILPFDPERYKEMMGKAVPKRVVDAYNKLREMNIAVMQWDSGPETADHRGHFWIWSEGITVETGVHTDYYNNFWGSDTLNKILENAGLYSEWSNPAYSCVYDN